MPKGRTIACLVFLAVIVLVAMTPSPRIERASEIEILLAPVVERLGMPTAIQYGKDLLVRWGDIVLILARDDSGHWDYAGLYREGESTVPSLFAMLMVQAVREMQRDGTWAARPTDPWGNPIPDEAIHPEVR